MCASHQILLNQTYSPSHRQFISLVIADHSEVIHRGMTAILYGERSITIAGVANSVRALKHLLRRHKVDVIIFNLCDDEEDLVTTTATLAENYTARLLIFRDNLSPYTIYRLLQAGVQGFISREASAERILSAIHYVSAGRLVLDTTYTSHAILSMMNHQLTSLTQRERKVLDCLVRGHTNKEIASILCIATKTVEGHIAHICAKLSVRSRTEAAVQAIQLGLSQPPTPL